MLLDTIFAPFVKERPICVMARAVLERLVVGYLLDRKIHNRVSLLPECLPYSLKQFPLSRILLRVT
jgi:hypothetical protein